MVISGERALLFYFGVAKVPGQRSGVRILMISRQSSIFTTWILISHYIWSISRKITKMTAKNIKKNVGNVIIQITWPGIEPTPPHVLKNWRLANTKVAGRFVTSARATRQQRYQINIWNQFLRQIWRFWQTFVFWFRFQYQNFATTKYFNTAGTLVVSA